MNGQGYGAAVERGTVLRVMESGPVVESIDRPGLMTGGLTVMGNVTVSEGDTVFFVAFEDGTGLILAMAQAGEG